MNVGLINYSTWLPDAENRLILPSFVLTQYQRVTDKTDNQTRRSSPLCARCKCVNAAVHKPEC